jgi:hypothetical protein
MKRLKNSIKLKALLNLISNFFYTLQDALLIIYFQVLIIIRNIDVSAYNMTIVTAADSSHYKSALQLINSALDNEPRCKIIFYDLGLNKDEIRNIKNLKIIYKIFDFEKHPSFYRLDQKDAGAYAWKPAIISKEIVSDPTLLIWMDAGNKVIKKLSFLKKTLIINSFYSPLSSGNVSKWTHPYTLETLLVSKKITNKRNLNAALIGINTHSDLAKKMIRNWFENSKIKDLILPEGAGKNNHRWDQSLLKIKYYKDFKKIFFPKTYKVFGVLIHQDID